MRHLEHELKALRQDVIDMWRLVISQVSTAGESILTFDKDLAMQVSMREKKVDAYELKIDNNCENIIALNQPVAVDLRFVLAVLKINSNLERIADFAYGIARLVINHPTLILDAELAVNANQFSVKMDKWIIIITKPPKSLPNTFNNTLTGPMLVYNSSAFSAN
jgi:phosphate transport system protein